MSEFRYCSGCKNISEFASDKTTRCISCVKKYNIDYYVKNKEKLIIHNKNYRKENSVSLKEKDRQDYIENKDKILEERKLYYENNKDIISNRCKIYYENNKQYFINYNTQYEKTRSKTDPVFKLRRRVSKNIYSHLKSNSSSKDGMSILKYLPYSIQQLKEHLESQFELWMTWDNHGNYNYKTWKDDDPSTWMWQLDHIMPQSDLPFQSMTDDNFRKCWALNNLRPYSAKQNLLDGLTKVRHFKKRCSYAIPKRH